MLCISVTWKQVIRKLTNGSYNLQFPRATRASPASLGLIGKSWRRRRHHRLQRRRRAPDCLALPRPPSSSLHHQCRTYSLGVCYGHNELRTRTRTWTRTRTRTSCNVNCANNIVVIVGGADMRRWFLGTLWVVRCGAQSQKLISVWKILLFHEIERHLFCLVTKETNFMWEKEK